MSMTVVRRCITFAWGPQLLIYWVTGSNSILFGRWLSLTCVTKSIGVLGSFPLEYFLLASFYWDDQFCWDPAPRYLVRYDLLSATISVETVVVSIGTTMVGRSLSLTRVSWTEQLGGLLVIKRKSLAETELRHCIPVHLTKFTIEVSRVLVNTR